MALTGRNDAEKVELIDANTASAAWPPLSALVLVTENVDTKTKALRRAVRSAALARSGISRIEKRPSKMRPN